MRREVVAGGDEERAIQTGRLTVENIPTEIQWPRSTEVQSIYVAFRWVGIVNNRAAKRTVKTLSLRLLPCRPC